MSLEPMVWALSGDAPVADVNEYAILGCMAETADRDGCGTWQSKETIAHRVKVSEETVKRCWRNLLRRGLIAKGDQSLVKHYRADRRPVVYDLLIPYEWFSNIERTNTERARLGREPLTPRNRPPIAAPEPRKERTDKGASRPKHKPADQGAPERGNSQTPRRGTSGPHHGGTTSRRRGNYESPTGELADPQTSTSNPTTEPAVPPVPPSLPEPDARELSRTDGRTDGGEAGQQMIRDTGTPVDRVKASTATAASAGVMLLLEIGAAHPELAVSGLALIDQGAALDRRLANGWAPDHLRTAVTANPKNEPIRNAAAVLAYRISTLPEAPGIPPGHGAAGATAPAVAVPRPRSVQQEIQNRAQHECQGRDGFCGRQVPVEGALCSACRKPCSAACGRGPAEPARLDGRCQACVQDDLDAALPRCVDGCGRPAIRSDGRCPACHQETTHRQAEAQQLKEASEALAALLGTASP
ncbi:hypothetical protein [Kitasatospora sp. NPDC088346]|uniref:hypothetical protein n=1 Tax=Kitasatospora sp. NPDC088346 TaxID=3364073 RepID=UPI00382E46C4